MPIEDLMWVEKYRPVTLGGLINQTAIRHRLELLLEKKAQLPHLVFGGAPGGGGAPAGGVMGGEVGGGGRWGETVWG